ncbi:holo-[acyl-carrier-protein] synthase [Alishewanella longhuensis]|uniref:Holo-[acyl-carrier-protein] synthase n=1 Tax=Alishewanella longhuensis TaxID=1091037 RepID=A0ABQ3KWK2_9ALTE|nr:holo-ACP synthase [Alishewanella longhuensis]GHG65150.1 holo-[acyl-carrier-protein] synthase [Alishewanella longhuensis]
MAIRGLGTDIIEIARISHSLQQSPRLVQRVLTAFEQSEYGQHSQPDRYFAKRFAAKEAAAKALGTGIGRGVSFQHFEISNDAYGKPELTLSGYAAELAAQMGVSAVWLSISDEQAYACATVILEA